MPRLTRRAHVRRREFTGEHRTFVTYGMAVGSGAWAEYGRRSEIPADVLSEMRDAWAHFRDDIMADVAGEPVFWAGRRPWGQWKFEIGEREPTGSREAQAERLDELGLLTPVELGILGGWATGPRNECHAPAFRRTWSWWRFLSPLRRDKSETQVQQLIAIDSVLTERERFIAQHGRDIDFFHGRPAPFVPLGHLSNRERETLGMPFIDGADEELTPCW